jgi:hypothetical protein
VGGLDPQLRAATVQQLARRRELLLAGATHVGWKLGLGERERIGRSLAVGHVTSATLLAAGATYSTGGLTADLRADVELAVRLGPALSVASYGVALEIVDLAPVLTTPEAVVATNVFHRAVALGDPASALPPAVVASAFVDGREQARGEAAVPDVAARRADDGGRLRDHRIDRSDPDQVGR